MEYFDVRLVSEQGHHLFGKLENLDMSGILLSGKKLVMEK